MILARTIKGKGVASVEGKDGWHGKAFKKGEEADRAIAELKTQLVPGVARPAIAPPSSKRRDEIKVDYSKMPAPSYKPGDQVATREAWGTALASLGAIDPRVVALDADVKNSTFSDRFEKAYPDRFYQNFIAEQIMVGAGMGLAARGAIAFATTFACFLSRAADFIRMAGISNARNQLNLKLTGSHAGVSIGEDGPSQMALEDLSMMRAVPNLAVLYPCDAVSTERLVVEMASWSGLAYMRTSRPKTDIIYGLDEKFPIGGSKVLHQSPQDVATVVAAGVTVFEARKAYEQLKREGVYIRVIDAYSVAPIDAATLVASATATRGVVLTVEDHYAAGGLGEAVAEAIAPAGFVVKRLAVRELPRSGQPQELLERYGISARQIAEAVRTGRVS
jgi:transketolase